MQITKKYLNELRYQVIGCAIEVHKYLGPGLLESVRLRRMFFAGIKSAGNGSQKPGLDTAGITKDCCLIRN